MRYSKFEQYTKESYSGRKLLEKHSLNEYGIWEVRGEDPNCDLGGQHSNPFICIYQGTLLRVLELAVDHPNFWQWGAGGEIKKIDIIDLVEGGE